MTTLSIPQQFTGAAMHTIDNIALSVLARPWMAAGVHAHPRVRERPAS